MTKRAKNKPLPPLIKRQRALIATQQRFAGKPMKLGKADCIILSHFHLKKMGHKNLPAPGKYSSPGGAMKRLDEVLEKLGVKAGSGLEGLFDKLLTRIPPAAMLPGDIALVPAEEGAPAWRAGTVVISLGRKFLGWHPDHPVLSVIEPTVDQPFTAAWRA